MRSGILKAPASLRSIFTSPYLLLASASLFWAGNFIVGRAFRGEIPPVSLAFWRWAFAVALLLPASFSQLRKHRALLLKQWRLILALGATGVAAFQLCAYVALTMTTAVNGALYISATPVFIFILAAVYLREAITLRQALGIGVSLFGALLIVVRGNLAHLSAFQGNPGDLWMLGAVLAWAVYSVLLKRRPTELPLLVLFTASAITGLLLLMPLYLYELQQVAPFEWNVTNTLALLYIAIFASVLAFHFWNKGVEAVGPNRAGMFLHLMPVFGALLGMLLLDERLATFHLAGAAFVFLGIALTSQ